MGGISPINLGIILLIVFMLFGTKKLRNLGSDLGGALKGFKTAMKDEDAPAASDGAEETPDETIGAMAEKGETKS